MAELGRSSDDLEMLVGWNAATRGAAFFAAGLDLASGTIRTIGGGVWLPADVERYFEEQRRVVAEARRRGGAIKACFDVRDWVVEGQHSATQFQEANRQLYVAQDRLVAVVASSLYKQFSRTALTVGSPESFVSANAAETWLQAYDANPLVSHAA